MLYECYLKQIIQHPIQILFSKEWFRTVITFILPNGSLKPLSIEYVNDAYRRISAKNCSRDKRGQFETRVHLLSLEQKMQISKEWSAFFHNISLIHL